MTRHFFRKRIGMVLTFFVLLAFAPNSGEAQLGRQSGLLDPNIATEQQLAALPHMNAALAKSVIDSRPFLSMTELNALLSKSLSKEQLAELYAKTFLHVNLNTASESEILLIPSLGPRMAHEFEEYRPYRALEQFRRRATRRFMSGS